MTEDEKQPRKGSERDRLQAMVAHLSSTDDVDALRGMASEAYVWYARSSWDVDKAHLGDFAVAAREAAARVDLERSRAGTNVAAPRIESTSGADPTPRMEAAIHRLLSWRDEHRVSCGEAVYQVENIHESLPDMVIGLLEIVGYVKGEADGDEGGGAGDGLPEQGS